MFSDLVFGDKLWKFIGGNFSVNVGIIENIEFLDIGGNTHYKFDLRVTGSGSDDKTIRDIISCPYLLLDESEHRLLQERSRVTVITKITPKIGGGKIILSKSTIALKIEGSPDTLLRLTRMIF